MKTRARESMGSASLRRESMGSASPRTQVRHPHHKKLSNIDVGAGSASLPCSGHPPSDLCMTRQSHALPHMSPMGSLHSDTLSGVRSSIERFEPRGAAEMRVTPERLGGYSGQPAERGSLLRGAAFEGCSPRVLWRHSFGYRVYVSK